MSLLFLGLLFVGLIIIFLYDHFNRTGRLLRKIPGPGRLPIVGNTLRLLLPLGKFIFNFDIFLKFHKNNSLIKIFHTKAKKLMIFILSIQITCDLVPF